MSFEKRLKAVIGEYNIYLASDSCTDSNGILIKRGYSSQKMMVIHKKLGVLKFDFYTRGGLNYEPNNRGIFSVYFDSKRKDRDKKDSRCFVIGYELGIVRVKLGDEGTKKSIWGVKSIVAGYFPTSFNLRVKGDSVFKNSVRYNIPKNYTLEMSVDELANPKEGEVGCLDRFIEEIGFKL
jgi:hypothetical protein